MGVRKYNQFELSWFADFDDLEVRRVCITGWNESVGINYPDTVQYLVQWKEDYYDPAEGICEGIRDDYAKPEQLFDKRKDAVAALKQHLLDTEKTLEEKLADHREKMNQFAKRWKIKFHEEATVQTN